MVMVMVWSGRGYIGREVVEYHYDGNDYFAWERIVMDEEIGV